MYLHNPDNYTADADGWSWHPFRMVSVLMRCSYWHSCYCCCWLLAGCLLTLLTALRQATSDVHAMVCADF